MSPDEQQEYDALGVTEGKLFDVDPQEAKHLYEDASLASRHDIPRVRKPTSEPTLVRDSRPLSDKNETQCLTPGP